MSTLFFDGFDRGTILKTLDSNYWKTQLKNYPQYAFGAYSYNHSSAFGGSYIDSFTSYSPNNGTLPVDIYLSSGPYFNYSTITNSYPGHGKTPGFLALSNIAINQSAFNLTPLSYIALTGFPAISGTKSYFGIRCLGVETKDTDYHASDSLIEGRFGSKHPFLAFCSGNTTGLLLNFIRVTGETLLNLRQEGDSEQNYTGQKITIGLEVEQNNGISGIFDLNLGDTLNSYRITPPYCGTAQPFDPRLIPIGNPHKILTIADTKMGPYNSNTISRWTHFEIEVDHTGGSIRLKVEGADALVIDTEEFDRELWDILINISGFYYDNVRIFNRTYNSTAISPCTGALTSPNFTIGYNNMYYYMMGSLTLIDDVTLVDNTGNNPKYFLGKDCKVLPLAPGFGSTNNVIFNDQENTIDGPLQWLKSSNVSNKALLSSFDRDNSYIYNADINKVTAVVYSNSYYNPFVYKDPNSTWRYSYNDGIGGMKIYNYARKEFLDSSFRNVINRTGLLDENINNNIFLIHGNEINPTLDYSRYAHTLSAIGGLSLNENGKFDQAISFSSGGDGLLVANNSLYDIRGTSFTIEAWIKFDTTNDHLILFDRKYRNNIPSIPLNGSESSDSDFTASNIGYRISVNTGFARIESFYVSLDQLYVSTNCSTPAVMDLILPSAVSTGQWNHIAITRQRMNTSPVSGYFTVFLNGISGTGYYASNIYNGSSYFYEGCPGSGSSNSLTGPKIFKISGTDFDSDPYQMHFGVLSSKYLPSNSNTQQIMPFTYFGGTGHIDELMVSSGLVRYTSNFTPSTSPYKGPIEGFIEFGPTHELTRTNYRLIQYYQMNHPETLEPFTSGQIITSGIKLGVKKL